MEPSWPTFLISVASLAFGLSCNILSEVGGGPANGWCPSSTGNATSLFFLGASGVIPSLLLLNDEAKGPRTQIKQYLAQLRICALSLLWLKGEGRIWVLLACVGVESLAKLVLVATGLTTAIPTSRTFYIAYSTGFSVLAASAAYKSQGLIFVSAWMCLSLLDRATEKSDGQPIEMLLEFLGPVFGGVLISSTATTQAALVMFICLQLLLAPVVFDSLSGQEIVVPRTYGATRISMPFHRAVQVVGSLALASITAIALSPLVIGTYILSDSPTDGPRVGFLFAVVHLAERAGPRLMDRIHQETGSLLKTGLIGFWLCVIAIVPAVAVFSFPVNAVHSTMWGSTLLKETMIIITCAAWHLIFTGLVSVEHKIVDEWSGLMDPTSEQEALCSIAVCAASFTIVTISSGVSSLTAVTVAAFFALICSVLAAACYTVWFLQNDRGPWRLVDGEGRELLRVTG